MANRIWSSLAALRQSRHIAVSPLSPQRYEHSRSTTPLGVRHEPPCSLNLKVLFIEIEQSDLETFFAYAKRFSLPTITRENINIDKREIYSANNLGSLRKWYRSLPFSVAYQCDALLYNCLLNPVELLSLQDRIGDMINTDEALATRALKHLNNVLKRESSNVEVLSQDLFETALREVKASAVQIYRRKEYARDHVCPQVSYFEKSFEKDV